MDSVHAFGDLNFLEFKKLSPGLCETYLEIGLRYLDLAKEERQSSRKRGALSIALDALCQAKRLGAGARACAVISEVLASFAMMGEKDGLEVRWFADRAILEAEEAIAMEPGNPLSYLALSHALTVRARQLCPEGMLVPLLLKAAMAYDVARKLQFH